MPHNGNVVDDFDFRHFLSLRRRFAPMMMRFAASLLFRFLSIMLA